MTLKNEVEALLFASGRFMKPEGLSDILNSSQKKVKEALEELEEDYSSSDHSLKIAKTEMGWKMGVKDDYLPLVQKIVADTELPTPVLQTLAIVAWKRPVLQSEVINIRGDHAYKHIHLLRDLGFITREKHGRTYKLKLAEKFFEYFDVEGEKEIRELFDDVEKPDPGEQLGDLDVVDYEEEKQEQLEEGKLGDLEIVDEDGDPLEKRKVAQEELDKLDEEIEEISKRTDEAVAELEEFKEDEEEPEEESPGIGK